MVQQYYDSNESCGIEEVFKHVDYLKTKLGVNRVGVSTNFDANLGLAIKDLEDVSKLINFTTRLVKAGYSEADVTAIIGGNFIRAWSVAESVSENILEEELGHGRPTGGIFGL
jgi:microsomal dipeptidase-like Zn-dependent dipeptidase